jgi:hypothetical protein
MKELEVRFVSGNEYKIAEATRILAAAHVRVVPSHIKIDELQIADMEKLVRDKALQAFARLGRPLFVEHTGLHLDQLGGLPGGLTEVFWETIQADRFAALFGTGTACGVKASTTIGYCDGRTIRQFHGEVSGRMPSIRPTMIGGLRSRFEVWRKIRRRFGGKFVEISNVGDFANVQERPTQIVKFHGDFDDDSSLVLTETDYFERLAFETPLDIKLRADAIGKTLFFIGYSLDDINVRLMLYRLHRLWERSEFAAARPKSFVFFGRPNPVQELILQRRGLWPIVSEDEDPGVGLENFSTRSRETRLAREPASKAPQGKDGAAGAWERSRVQRPSTRQGLLRI